MIDPMNMMRAGVVNMSDALLLEYAGRAGIGGVTTVQAAEACRLPNNTVHGCFVRLRELGLVCPPTRDTAKGRVNRHVLAPAGLALLQQSVVRVNGYEMQLPIKMHE